MKDIQKDNNNNNNNNNNDNDNDNDNNNDKRTKKSWTKKLQPLGGKISGLAHHR